MTATSPAFSTKARTGALSLFTLVLTVMTLLGTNSAANGSVPSIIDPDQPVLVSAEVTRVLNPVQTPATFKWSNVRLYGVLRSVWDLPGGTETDTFAASAWFGSDHYCDGSSCVGSSDFHILMPSPGTGRYAACTRSVTGQRLTLDCPITMRKYQETGNYLAGVMVASWHRVVDGIRTSGQTEAETRITARIRTASRIVASVRSIETAHGARSRLVGTVQVLEISRSGTGYAARYVKHGNQTVAVSFQAPGGTERTLGAPSPTSTGFARTYGYRPAGTWRIRYAGSSAVAPSWASRTAHPLVVS